MPENKALMLIIEKPAEFQRSINLLSTSKSEEELQTGKYEAQTRTAAGWVLADGKPY